MQTSTLPVETEYDTEPMRAINLDQKCCAANCQRPVAVPDRRCERCGGLMCRIHAQSVVCEPECGGK